MMPPMLPLRRLRHPAALLAAATLLLAGGCSTDDPAPAAGGTPSAATSTGQSAGQSLSPTRTAPPAAVDPALRERPEVRAIEVWAASYARAVNDGDRRFAATSSTATLAGREWMERNARPEWGRWFPGPLPVAPLAVRPVDDAHREVDACVLVSGWTQESRTVRRTRSRELVGHTFRMRSAGGGRWLVDRIVAGGPDCAGVVPPAQRW